MDQEVLVKEQIDAGSELLARLVAGGLDVSAAFWTKAEGDDRWYLYLVSSLVDREGPFAVYEAVDAAVRASAGGSNRAVGIDSSVVKTLETTHPLAKEVTDLMHRHPKPSNIWYRIRYLRNYPVEGIYIYALPSPAPAAAS
jgi:hypothetical protein